MEYETARLLAYQSYQQWISGEFLSFQWFVLVGVLIVTYTIWLKLVDTRRITEILLVGSLSTVAFMVLDMVLAHYLGLWQYEISLTPIEPPVFMVSISIAPILHMLSLQYTSSWKGYLLWSGISMAFLAFILLPVYGILGIFLMHKGWNYMYHFLMMFSVSVIARGMLQWLLSLEQQHVDFRSTAPMFTGLQPAAIKPLESDKDDTTDNNG
ncbi:MAG: hypothetical protein H7X79_01945 [Sporomusaceae bacterium]|nr:hypothetical protein [Sporomusaceae bacterium]